MAAPKFQHTIQLTEELELAWRLKQAQEPDVSFNGFICTIMKEALCVTAAPTLTIRSGM